MKRTEPNRLPGIKLCILLLLQLFITTKGITADRINNGINKFAIGSIGDFIWNDLDGDGIQDSGEPGVEGVEIMLVDAGGSVIGGTNTDASGFYEFSGVDAGGAGKSYQVWFKLPWGYRFSPRTGSAGDVANSDADPVSGKTIFFTLLPGQAITNIDAGIISPAAGTLPLHTFQLSGSLKGTTVKLRFIAENEMNTSHFEVERSVDGIVFTNITTLNVSGPVNTPTEYSFTTDISTLMSYNVVYYRVKAEDNAGRSAYTNVAPIRLDKIAGIRAWPNPFVSEIRVSYNGSSNTTLDITVSDNAGKTAWRGTYAVSGGLNQLSLGGMDKLPSGLYTIRIVDINTGKSFSERLVK